MSAGSNDCDRFRPRLAELLTGALDEGESAACLAHLQGCADCGERLASLEHLEADLTALGPARAPSSSRNVRTLALALALVAVLAAAVVFWKVGGLRAPELPVLDGELRWPLRTRVIAAHRTTLALAHALVDVSAGTTLVRLGPRELELLEGELALRVEPDVSPFAVRTPLGAASTNDGAFAVQVELQEGATKVMNLSRNTAVTGAAVVAVLVTSGVVLFRPVDGAPVRLGAGDQAVVRSGSIDVTRASELAQAAALHSATVARLSSENAKLEADLAKEKAHAAELEKQLAKLSAEAAPAAKPADASAKVGQPTNSSKASRFHFAQGRDVPELAKIDWNEAGAASLKLSGLLKDLMAKQSAGEPIPPELYGEVNQENQKLVKLALAVHGKLPTSDHSTANSEYTNPIVLANVESGALDQAGLSLTDDQVAAINALGDDYDVQWQAQQAAYGPDTLALEKTLDELALKKTFCDRMDSVMTPDQRAALFDPATRHMLGVDLYSPMLMVITTCQPIGKSSTADLKKAISAGWLTAWDLDDTRKPELDAAAATLVDGVAPPTVPAAQLRQVKIDEALADGRANVRALKDLVTTIGADPDARKSLLGATFFFVPRVTTK